MKYFEFNDFEYYALIAAYTVEEAVKFYKEIICEIDGDLIPDEIDYIDVYDKLEPLIGHVPEEELMDFNSPDLILIDTSLIQVN